MTLRFITLGWQQNDLKKWGHYSKPWSVAEKLAAMEAERRKALAYREP